MSQEDVSVWLDAHKGEWHKTYDIAKGAGIAHNRALRLLTCLWRWGEIKRREHRPGNGWEWKA